MNYLTAFSKIPWGKILKGIPVISEIVKTIKETVDSILRGKNKFEASLLEQSNFNTKVANQLESLSKSLEILSARLFIFICLSIGAFAIGVISLTILLFKK